MNDSWMEKIKGSEGKHFPHPGAGAPSGHEESKVIIHGGHPYGEGAPGSMSDAPQEGAGGPQHDLGHEKDVMEEGAGSADPSHPGFASVQNKIASKEGVSHEAAGAILASASRGASASAKAANPRLKRVK